MAFTPSRLLVRRPSAATAERMGGFGAGGVGGAAGMGQADLAARGQGAAGLAGLLGQQPAAVGGRKEPLVDLALVEGAGGDQVVEVAGGLPQLAVALAHRSGGDPGQLLGQGRPGVAVPRAVGGGRELVRARSAAGAAGAAAARAAPREPGRVGCRGPGRRATGRGGRRRGGWVGRPHSRPGPASPHAPGPAGGRCPGRSGPDRNASRRHRCGPAAPNSPGHGRRPAARMAGSPAGPSTSRTSNRWPVARPMLAWGWRVHQARTRARLVVASLTPWGTRLPRGCLPTWPQPGSRHEQLVLTAGLGSCWSPVRAWRSRWWGRGWCRGRTGMPREA